MKTVLTAEKGSRFSVSALKNGTLCAKLSLKGGMPDGNALLCRGENRR